MNGFLYPGPGQVTEIGQGAASETGQIDPALVSAASKVYAPGTPMAFEAVQLGSERIAHLVAERHAADQAAKNRRLMMWAGAGLLAFWLLK